MVAVEPDSQMEVEPEDDFAPGLVLCRGEWLGPGEVGNRMFALARLAGELGSLPGDELSEWVGFSGIPDSPEQWILDEEECLWDSLESLL